MLEGIDRNIDMVLFVGYHAPAGSAGVLSHTFYASALTDMRVNGRRCSESLFNALLAGSYGVGVGMISGDDIACQDAREVIPGIETVEVKRAVDRFTAICIPPGRTEQMIRTGAAAAVRNPSAHPPIRIEPPLIWETHWVGTNSVTMGSWVPGVQVVDPHTLRWVSGDMESSMRMWNTVATMAGAALEGRFM
jgi:D-amino peptidase